MSKLTALKSLKTPTNGTAPIVPEPVKTDLDKVETVGEKINSTPAIPEPVKTASSSKIQNLKPVKTESAEIKASKSDEIFKEYFETLSDGQSHTIKSLLDKFGLSHTSSGREKLRICKRKMLVAGAQFIDGTTDGNKTIQLIK